MDVFHMQEECRFPQKTALAKRELKFCTTFIGDRRQYPLCVWSGQPRQKFYCSENTNDDQLCVSFAYNGESNFHCQQSFHSQKHNHPSFSCLSLETERNYLILISPNLKLQPFQHHLCKKYS